jgi:N-glycosidase YbiA
MIDKFDGTEFGFLSNFYPSKVKLGDIIFPTIEHAFQAAKTLDIEERLTIKEASTPGVAKIMGRGVKLRPDWEEIKISVMEDLVRQKFTNDPILKQKLLDTRHQILVEGNHWHDTFWGVCNNVGQNNLGKILMKIRAEFQNEQARADTNASR